jgi:hypothetical protein
MLLLETHTVTNVHEKGVNCELTSQVVIPIRVYLYNHYLENT